MDGMGKEHNKKCAKKNSPQWEKLKIRLEKTSLNGVCLSVNVNSFNVYLHQKNISDSE